MARHPRLAFPGVALHVVQRGNNRSACFIADGDYLTYLSHLRFLSRKYACDVHAYCLMTNHVHLLLTPNDEEGCTLLMRDLGRTYVPYFNRRHGRTGSLWEGRFRSCLVESASYVLACYRYIEMNPVRAGMVSIPGAYAWSSHAVNTGARADPLVRPHCEYGGPAWYATLVQAPVEPAMLRSIREATQGGYPLVSEAFKSRALAGCRTERGKPGPKVEMPEATYACEPG